MSSNTVNTFFVLPHHICTRIRTNMIVIALTIAFVSSLLVACSASTAAGKSTPPTPTHVIAPSPAVTPTPTPSPTLQPTVLPVPTLTPTLVQAAPAVLDVRPSSMSLVGHLDCTNKGAFVCFARVLSRSSNQSDLHWSAYTNVPGNVVFSPVSGVLAPGQSTLITITVPLTACTPGLFFFRGPANTHTIAWAC